MSDEAIVSIVVSVIGFLSLWLKARYGEQKVEEATKKLDANTAMTAKIEKQTNGGLDDRFADHGSRISALESKVGTIDLKVDAVNKNLDSTRHDIRGHLGTLTNAVNSLTLLVAGKAVNPLPPPTTATSPEKEA